MSSDIDEEVVSWGFTQATASYRELRYRGADLPTGKSHSEFPGWALPVFASLAGLAILLAVAVGFYPDVPTQSVRSYPAFALVLEQPETLRKRSLQIPTGGVNRPEALKKSFPFSFRLPKRPKPEKPVSPG